MISCPVCRSSVLPCPVGGECRCGRILFAGLSWSFDAGPCILLVRHDGSASHWEDQVVTLSKEALAWEVLGS